MSARSACRRWKARCSTRGCDWWGNRTCPTEREAERTFRLSPLTSGPGSPPVPEDGPARAVRADAVKPRLVTDQGKMSQLTGLLPPLRLIPLLAGLAPALRPDVLASVDQEPFDLADAQFVPDPAKGAGPMALEPLGAAVSPLYLLVSDTRGSFIPLAWLIPLLSWAQLLSNLRGCPFAVWLKAMRGCGVGGPTHLETLLRGSARRWQ